MAGARRQIFMVFAGFMMVERFGFHVHELTGLYLANLLLNMLLGPLFGKAVGHFGERNTLILEYFGLALVFLAYGGIYLFSFFGLQIFGGTSMSSRDEELNLGRIEAIDVGKG